MPEQRMFNRGSKTPAVTGHRANINVGAIASLAGGGAKADTPAIGADQQKAYAESDGANAMRDIKGDASIPSSPSSNFVPQHYSAPWYDIAGRQQANQLNAGFDLENLRAQHQMEEGLAVQKAISEGQMSVHGLDNDAAAALARVKGAQELEQIKQTGTESRAGQTNAGNIAYTASKGVAPGSLDAASSELDPKEIGNRSTDLSNQSGILGLLAKIQGSPEFAKNLGAGRNAEAYSPVVNNTAKGPILNPLQTGFANPSYDSRMTLNGVMPGGTTETVSRDPKTFATTTTTQPSYKPGTGFPSQIPIVSAPSGIPGNSGSTPDTGALQPSPSNPIPSSGAMNNYPPKPPQPLWTNPGGQAGPTPEDIQNGIGRLLQMISGGYNPQNSLMKGY